MSEQKHNREKQLKLYSVFKGEVVSVQEYGAFIRIPDYNKNGLVHRSQISYTKVDDAKAVLDVGDSVFCKIISLGDDNDKIALSMKCVNQGSGKDQDPNHLLTVQDEQRKKSGGGYVKPKIELGAIFNTNCKQCGGQGHLATDCFQVPGSKTYDLVPEIEIPSPEVIKVRHNKKKKKEKKLKKKKHKKYESDSGSSSEDEKRRHSKQKKSKKLKSRKRSHSSSDTESSSDDEPNQKSKHKKSKKSKSSHKRRHGSSDSDDRSSDDRRKKIRKKERKSYDDHEKHQRYKCDKYR